MAGSLTQSANFLDSPPPPLSLHGFSASGQSNQVPAMSPDPNHVFEMARPKSPRPSELRQNLFLICITLTQLVQMIPLGVGINSGLALGAAVGALRIDSVWIVASYPLTQGSFVLIGKS